MQVIKNFRWYAPESRAYYIMIQIEIQVPKVLQCSLGRPKGDTIIFRPILLDLRAHVVWTFK